MAQCEPTYKVTVPVAILIEKIEAYLASTKAKHVKALADHEKAVERFKANAARRLRELADDAAKGKLPGTRYAGDSITIHLGTPPAKPTLSVGQIEKDLALLQSATESSITIKGQDYLASYL